ncbi:MAG: hypothetical protein ABEI57_06570 [Halapricum sp.]
MNERVTAALNTLEAEGVVTVPSMDDTSPVGKGRPAYELVPEVSEILDALSEDDRLLTTIDNLETA